MLLAVVSAAALCVAAGCTEDAPPLPDAVEVTEALQEAGLPLYAVAGDVGGGADGGCLRQDARVPCEQNAVFLDERSHVEAGDHGSAVVDRSFYGGFVEIYADPDTARRRAETIAARYANVSHAVFAAGHVVLNLGGAFMGYAAPYEGDDYRKAFEDLYGPLSFLSARPELIPTPVTPVPDTPASASAPS